MTFIIFRVFLEFSEFIFDLNLLKKIKKNDKKGGLFLRGTHMGETWHARPCGRATRAHASVCVARR